MLCDKTMEKCYAYVLISTLDNKEIYVCDKLREVKELTELVGLRLADGNIYNLLAKIETNYVNLLGEIVVNDIRTIDGVCKTKTLAGITF